MMTARRILAVPAALATLLAANSAASQPLDPTAGFEPSQWTGPLKILALLTLLSLLPAIVLTMTSFTRVVVVLSFVRKTSLSLARADGASDLSVVLLFTLQVPTSMGTAVTVFSQLTRE